MFEFLSNCWDALYGFIQSVGSFLSSMVHGLFTMIKSFPFILRLVSSSVGSLPSIFAVFVGITVTITIVYLIIGRQTGGDSGD